MRSADTIAVMDALGIDKAVVWGNSMDGRMVYALMHYYPERFIVYCAGGICIVGDGCIQLHAK